MSEGKPEIKSITQAVKDKGVKEILDAAKEQKQAIKRGFLDVAKEKGRDLRKRLAAASDKTLERLPFGLGKKLKPGTEITEEYIKTQEAGITILEKYLGEYRQTEGRFVGGVEAKAEEVLESNQVFLDEFQKTGQLGYQDFGTAVTKLFDVRDTHKHSLKETDEDFRRVNVQGQRLVNLAKLETKEKRLDWIAKSFGLSAKKAEALWNEAHIVRHGLLAADQTKEEAMIGLVTNWNARGVGRSEQIVVLGLLQITNANGIENFLAEGRLKDKNNRNLTAFSLGGEKLKKLQTQYYELATSFLTSVSQRGEHLLWDPGRGIVIANISLRDRTVIRDATDVRQGTHVIEEVQIDTQDFLNKAQTELAQFLLTERAPDIEGKVNPWDEFVARAEFETAYWQRYKGTVNVKDRYTKEAHARAAFDEVASAKIIKEHWFGRITGFKQAVAKYTLAEGDDKTAFAKMMERAKKNGDKDLIQRLEDAETYAKQFLEMCGAPVGGRETKRDFTFAQLFDPTVSSRSGPISERINDPGMDGFRQALAKSVEKKTYRHKERTNEETGEKEIVFYAIPGFSGEITVVLESRGLLEMAEKGGGELLAYLTAHGLYKEAGYWPEWEKTVGPGFTPYLRDGVEHATGYLTRTNLATYQKREIGRRLGELYDGSEQHNRFFIQFLLERKQEIRSSGWEETFQQETGVPFDPLNDYHLTILAHKLGIKTEELPAAELVNELANPDKWGLYFDPLNESHMSRIDSSSRELGFHRFFLNVLWAFDGVTELRESSSTMIEMGIHGIKYEKGIWTGLTAQKLEDFAAKEWKQCKPDEKFEVLAYLIQKANEAQTEELEEMLATGDRSVTHKLIGDLFDHGLWRMASLTRQEKEKVLSSGRILGQRIPILTPEEIRDRVTILGKAAAIKAERKQSELRGMVDRRLFYELAAQPQLSLGDILGKTITEELFKYGVFKLTRFDLEKLRENPFYFLRLNLSNYEMIKPDDPRYERLRRRFLTGLFATASRAIDNMTFLAAYDPRKIPWDVMVGARGAANQGWGSELLEDEYGVENITPLGGQFTSRFNESLRVAWDEIDGEVIGLSDAQIRFSSYYLGIDLTDKRVVDMQSSGFKEKFKKMIEDNPLSLMTAVYFINYGIETFQGRHTFFEWYFRDVVSLMGEGKIPKPTQWKDFPEIEVVKEYHDASGNPVLRTEKVKITYDMVQKQAKEKADRDPIFSNTATRVPLTESERTNINSFILFTNDLLRRPALPTEADIPAEVIPQLYYYATFFARIGLDKPTDFLDKLPEILSHLKTNLFDLTTSTMQFDRLSTLIFAFFGIELGDKKDYLTGANFDFSKLQGTFGKGGKFYDRIKPPGKIFQVVRIAQQRNFDFEMGAIKDLEYRRGGLNDATRSKRLEKWDALSEKEEDLIATWNWHEYKTLRDFVKSMVDNFNIRKLSPEKQHIWKMWLGGWENTGYPGGYPELRVEIKKAIWRDGRALWERARHHIMHDRWFNPIGWVLNLGGKAFGKEDAGKSATKYTGWNWYAIATFPVTAGVVLIATQAATGTNLIGAFSSTWLSTREIFSSIAGGNVFDIFRLVPGISPGLYFAAQGFIGHLIGEFHRWQAEKRGYETLDFEDWQRHEKGKV